MKTYKQRNQELESKNRELNRQLHLRVQETLLYKDSLKKENLLDIVEYYKLMEMFVKAKDGLEAIKYVSKNERAEWKIADECLQQIKSMEDK